MIPFFAYPPEVRRIIYTTNAIESLNSSLRSAVSRRGHFPNDEAALKLLFLCLAQDRTKLENGPHGNGPPPKHNSAVTFGERFTNA